MVPVGMGIQSAVAANSSVMRAVGTTLAKQGLTMAAGYGTDKAGEALGLPPELRMLMSMGAMTVAGYGVEALDTRFNVSGYHVTSKMPQFGFSDYMDSEDAASYNKHWDDLASGKHLPPGMDVDDLARYNLGAQKANENLALSKVDAEAFAKLRAQEAARLNALEEASYNKHWDDLASGKHLPPGMDADDLARYNLGLQKVDENLALSKIDAEALAKLRAQEAARPASYTNKYTELSANDVKNILESRGLDTNQVENLINSFDGPIYSRIGYKGETFFVTESKQGSASGIFVTRESAGSTAADRINKLALPPNNTAAVETPVQLGKTQILLEGKVAPQPDWSLIANDGIERSGGAWQVVTDGGIYKNAIRR